MPKYVVVARHKLFPDIYYIRENLEEKLYSFEDFSKATKFPNAQAAATVVDAMAEQGPMINYSFSIEPTYESTSRISGLTRAELNAPYEAAKIVAERAARRMENVNKILKNK